MYPKEFEFDKGQTIGFALMKIRGDYTPSNCPFEIIINLHDQIFNIYQLTLSGTYSNWHMKKQKVGSTLR